MGKRISFRVTDQQYADAEKEVKEGRFLNVAEVGRWHYLFGWDKNHQPYKEDLKERLKNKDKEPLTEEEKIKKDLEKNDLREKVKLEKKITEGKRLCALLGGKEITPDDSNILHCEYHTYIENNDRQSVRSVYNRCPIEDIKEWDVENQYQDFVNQRGVDITNRLKGLPIVE